MGKSYSRAQNVVGVVGSPFLAHVELCSCHFDNLFVPTAAEDSIFEPCDARYLATRKRRGNWVKSRRLLDTWSTKLRESKIRNIRIIYKYEIYVRCVRYVRYTIFGIYMLQIRPFWTKKALYKPRKIFSFFSSYYCESCHVKKFFNKRELL